jgi:hypothetical protein
VESARTADGHPDLQGYWTNDSYTPLERPTRQGQRVLHTRGGQGVPEARLDRLNGQSATDIHYDDATWQAENYAKQPHLRTSIVTDPRTAASRR